MEGFKKLTSKASTNWVSTLLVRCSLILSPTHMVVSFSLIKLLFKLTIIVSR